MSRRPSPTCCGSSSATWKERSWPTPSADRHERPARSFFGKVAIVTGGGTGIGEAVCRRFVREGAAVLVNGLPGDPIDDVAGAIQQDGGRSAAFAGDVEVEEHARACVDIARYGRLDILVNNAGVLLVNAETDDMPVDRFDEHVRCNTRSAFLMTRYALPYLRTTRGNVICAGSESGISGQPRNTVYGATKAFLHAFYAFLASDEASFVTGALWLVDGGSTPAKGAVGALAGPEASTPPPGQLGLRHTHDGTRNKDMTKIA